MSVLLIIAAVVLARSPDHFTLPNSRTMSPVFVSTVPSDAWYPFLLPELDILFIQSRSHLHTRFNHPFNNFLNLTPSRLSFTHIFDSRSTHIKFPFHKTIPQAQGQLFDGLQHIGCRPNADLRARHREAVLDNHTDQFVTACNQALSSSTMTNNPSSPSTRTR